MSPPALHGAVCSYSPGYSQELGDTKESETPEEPVSVLTFPACQQSGSGAALLTHLGQVSAQVNLLCSCAA